MSTFSVPVTRITAIKEHSGADKLQLAVVEGFQCVVPKDQYQVGDLVIYVPEGAIVPENILEISGLTGKLAGKAKNRVKAIRLRGELSRGLVLPLTILEHAPFGPKTFFAWDTNFATWEGRDVADWLGITKYEPVIPVHMRGISIPRPEWMPKYTDIERIERYMDVLQPGEEVRIACKLHGTSFAAGMSRSEKELKVSSRNHVLAFDENNVYWRAALKYNLDEVLLDILHETGAETAVIYGEIVGPGVQKGYSYGVESGDIALYWFDLMLDGKYQEIDYAEEVLWDLDPAPVEYRGPFDMKIVERLAEGPDPIAGTSINEGVVIRPVAERYAPNLGRVILKFINPEYSLQKNITEYH